MKIVFCTTCKNRTEHLKLTLPQNLADNPGATFVVLDYDSPDDLQRYLREAHAADVASGRLVVYQYKNGGAPFHIAHAKNLAARCGLLEGADVIVTQDADNYTGPGFADFVAGHLREPSVRRGAFLAPDFATIPKPGEPGRPPRGFAGRLACSAQTFIKAGGYDEMYDTWRGEDMDLVERLKRLGYEHRPIDLKYLNAIPHSSGARFREYPHAKRYETSEELKIIQARTETVVNYGRFGLGEVYRNFTRVPTRLEPVPTRIFGIGLQRTATTSLHQALKILGLDSFHWGAGEAPMIWHEMRALGRSKTLERWYALSDMPIPLMYERLDRAYPNSKFILTVRDEDDWVRSVERLWDPERNPNRWVWDVYPFSHHIHTVCYGQREFDAERFLARYRRHNAEVREYFRGRPGDLLVMRDMGWTALCAFLGVAEPAAPYPRSNSNRAPEPMTVYPC